MLFSPSQIKGSLEALLFAAGTAVEVQRAAAAVGISAKEAELYLGDLIDEYGHEKGIEIIRLENKYQMRTNPQFYAPVNNLMNLPEKKALTQVLLETLAIIAYKQPVTKGQIEEIRGLSADHAVNRLVELGLVSEHGRSDAPGRPILFETTDEFLRRFGISGLDELMVAPETENPIQ